jgi:hypothetical protein
MRRRPAFRIVLLCSHGSAAVCEELSCTIYLGFPLFLWFISRYREQVSSHRRRRFKLIKR